MKIEAPRRGIEPVDCEAYRVGDEVWILTEHASLTLPPDETDFSKLPADFINSDSEIDELVAALRHGRAGPRVKVAVDDTKKEATIFGGQPIDYDGFRFVTDIWRGHVLHWHTRDSRLQALYKGKPVAQIQYAKGHGAFEMLMAEIDGQLWVCGKRFCMIFAGALPANTPKKAVVRDGGPIDVLRPILSAPLAPAAEPKEDGQNLRIGPARVPKLQVDLIAHTLKVPLSWHASSHLDPVIGCHGERRVAIVMPIPNYSIGGDA